MSRIGVRHLLATLAFVGLSSGCAEDEARLLRPATLQPLPVDTKIPGELAPGAFDAFGVALPRELRLTKRFPDRVHASGSLPFEHVTNYFRDRLDTKQVETGPHRTMFIDAKVKGDVEKTVDVDVVRRIGRVTVVVTNKVRKVAPPEPKISEEERWGRMGLTPGGKVLEEFAQ